MNKSTEYIINKMENTAINALDRTTYQDGQEFRKTIISFCRYELPAIIEAYGPDDEPAINEAFNNYTDMLCKDGQISENIYDKITFDFENWED